jgi:hypothetical protein
VARCTKITTGTGAVTATLLAGGSASIFYGITAVNLEAAATYVKIYWEGTGTAPSAGAQSTTTPAVATTVPQLTFMVPLTSTSSYFAVSDLPLTNGGRIWYWISATVADGASQTALTTGGDLITLIYD